MVLTQDYLQSHNGPSPGSCVAWNWLHMGTQSVNGNIKLSDRVSQLTLIPLRQSAIVL